jgi:hypothetical protein
MILVISLATNVALLSIVFWLVYKIRKPGRAQKTDSKLLAELLNGGSVVVLRTLNPDNIFYYSPRDL